MSEEELLRQISLGGRRGERSQASMKPTLLGASHHNLGQLFFDVNRIFQTGLNEFSVN